MLEAAFYVGSAFWLGALHAATPGHGKTVAAAYLVGNRGRVVDAITLGVIVTLSHTGGIVLFGILALLGSSAFLPQQAEGWLALGTGLLIVGLGLWMLWGQRHGLPWTRVEAPARTVARASTGGRPATRAVENRSGADPAARGNLRGHLHDHGHAHEHGITLVQEHDVEPVDQDHASGLHHHGWGRPHAHAADLESARRPSFALLLGFGIAGGVMPDPAALAVLLSAIANGKLVLGLLTVLVFSLGFASVLVAVGLVAARVGQLVLDRLGGGNWTRWIQLATSLVVVGVGVVLTFGAWRTLAAFV